MKIKTAELTGIRLDWAVDQIEGGYARYLARRDPGQDRLSFFFWWQATRSEYSSSWAAGGPIVGREIVELVKCSLSSEGKTTVWWEAIHGMEDDADRVRMPGPTPLIAVMRSYVASKLGAEVDIPEELLS